MSCKMVIGQLSNLRTLKPKTDVDLVIDFQGPIKRLEIASIKDQHGLRYWDSVALRTMERYAAIYKRCEASD